jgi:hypothetical protein
MKKNNTICKKKRHGKKYKDGFGTPTRLDKVVTVVVLITVSKLKFNCRAIAGLSRETCPVLDGPSVVDVDSSDHSTGRDPDSSRLLFKTKFLLMCSVIKRLPGCTALELSTEERQQGEMKCERVS